MKIDITLILVFSATVMTGLLAGMNLDKSIVQLPARHRMGVVAFAAFSRANDLGNGLIAYPILGIGSALLTIMSAIRSEERRVGKECRARWTTDSYNKKAKEGDDT